MASSTSTSPVHDNGSCLHVLLAEVIELSSPPLVDLATLQECQCHWYIGEAHAHNCSKTFSFTCAPETVALAFRAFLVTDIGGDADLKFTLACHGEHIAVKFGKLSEMAQTEQFEQRTFELENVDGVLATVMVHSAVQPRWTIGIPPQRDLGECIFVEKEDHQAAYVQKHLFGDSEKQDEPAEQADDTDEEEEEEEDEDEEDEEASQEQKKEFVQETVIEEIKVVREVEETDDNGHHKAKTIVNEQHVEVHTVVHEVVSDEVRAHAPAAENKIEAAPDQAETQTKKQGSGWTAPLSSEEELDEQGDEVAEEEEGWYWEGEGGEEEELEGDECVSPTEDEMPKEAITNQRRKSSLSKERSASFAGPRSSLVASRKRSSTVGSKVSDVSKRRESLAQRRASVSSNVASQRRGSAKSIASRESKRHSMASQLSEKPSVTSNQVSRRKSSTVSSQPRDRTVSMASQQSSSTKRRSSARPSDAGRRKSSAASDSGAKSSDAARRRSSVKSKRESLVNEPFVIEESVTKTESPKHDRRSEHRERASVVTQDPVVTVRRGSPPRVNDEIVAAMAHVHARDSYSKNKESRGSESRDHYSHRHTEHRELRQDRMERFRKDAPLLAPSSSSSGSSSSAEPQHRSKSHERSHHSEKRARDAERKRKDMMLTERGPLHLTSGYQDYKQRRMVLRSKMQLAQAWEAVPEVKSEHEFDVDGKAESQLCWEIDPRRGRFFRVEAKTVTTRCHPHIDAARMGQDLLHGDVFKAKSSSIGDDGFAYLEIVHGRGWVFNDARVRPVRIVDDVAPSLSSMRTRASSLDKHFNQQAHSVERDSQSNCELQRAFEGDEDVKGSDCIDGTPTSVGSRSILRPVVEEGQHQPSPPHHHVQHHQHIDYSLHSHHGSPQHHSTHATHLQDGHPPQHQECHQNEQQHPHQHHGHVQHSQHPLHHPHQQHHHSTHPSRPQENHLFRHQDSHQKHPHPLDPHHQHDHQHHRKHVDGHRHNHQVDFQHHHYHAHHPHHEHYHQQHQAPIQHQSQHHHHSHYHKEVKQQEQRIRRSVVHQPAPIVTHGRQKSGPVQDKSSSPKQKMAAVSHQAHLSKSLVDTSKHGQEIKSGADHPIQVDGLGHSGSHFVVPHPHLHVEHHSQSDDAGSLCSRSFPPPPLSSYVGSSGIGLPKDCGVKDTSRQGHVHIQIDNISPRQHLSPLNSARSLNDIVPVVGRKTTKDTMSLSHNCSSGGQLRQHGWSPTDAQPRHANAILGQGREPPAIPSNTPVASPSSGSFPSAVARPSAHSAAGGPACLRSMDSGSSVRASPADSSFALSPRMADLWIDASSWPASGPSTPRGMFSKQEPSMGQRHIPTQHVLPYQQARPSTPQDMTFGRVVGDVQAPNRHISYVQTGHGVAGSWSSLIEHGTSGTRSPHLSTSFQAALQGHSSPPAPRRAPIVSKVADGHTANVVPCVPLARNAVGDMSTSSSSTGAFGGKLLGKVAVVPPTFSAPSSTSLVDSTGLRSTAGRRGRSTAEFSQSSTQPSGEPAAAASTGGFSRAQALLAAIERSIREHPACAGQDWTLDDDDLFKASFRSADNSIKTSHVV